MKEYIVKADHLIDGYGMQAVGELIRCKDCKYSVDEYDDGECYCNYEKDLRYIKDWDHYCSRAERRR